MQKLFLIITGFFLLTSNTYADKIYLKSGKVEEGKIRKIEVDSSDSMTSNIWCKGVILESDKGGGRCFSKNDIEKIEKTFKKPEGVALLAKDDKWGEEKYDYKTQLIQVNGEYVVGQSMQFHLVMKNVGEDIKWYDKQSIVHDALTIKDTNGDEVYCKIGSFQTMGGRRPIDTGEIVSLFENRNITNEYVIVKPGKYTIQFRDGIYGTSKDSNFPPSNIIEFEVKPGTPSQFDVFIASLKGIVPEKRWKLSQKWYNHQSPLGRKPVESIELVFTRHPESNLKVDLVFIQLWQTDEMANEVKQEETKGKMSEYLGKDSNGKYIYINVPENAEKFWPSARKDISLALKLEK